MANRAFRFVEATQNKLILLPLILTGGGSSNPLVLGEGDPNGTFFSAPAWSSTGVYTFNTMDSWAGTPNVQIAYQAASAAANTIAFCAPPVQATATAPITGVPTGAWQFTLSTFTAGSLADVATSGQIALQIAIRNSGDTT